MCGLWLPHGAAKIAGAPSVRCALLVMAHVLFRPLGVLHVQLWSRMVVPAHHMFVIYVVQLIQRKISCLESWHGLTLSETTISQPRALDEYDELN